MYQELPFDPFPYLESPHHQTVVSGILSFPTEPPSQQKLLQLEDGDKISIEITTPLSWKPSDPTVILLHGLCGSHQSPNLVRMAKRLEPLGIRIIRYNMRGCGSGKGLARNTYHSGRSDDLFESLKLLKREWPDSPFILIGFSLGGNIVLKLAGELAGMGKHFLKQVFAISPPVDLTASVERLGDPNNSIYERYFYKLLRANVYYLHRKFPELPPVHLPKDLRMYEFDQLYIVPKFNFRNAQDYYDKCSSIHYVPEISIPCRILLSEDDPIISSTSLDEIKLPSNIQLYKTKKGGHMGYIGKPTDKGFYWLDSLLVEWIQDVLK